MKTATELAQQIADRELDACCEWLCNKDILEPAWARSLIDAYRAARRPEPPSLKEQAIAALQVFGPGGDLTPDEVDTIRRALESLPD